MSGNITGLGGTMGFKSPQPNDVKQEEIKENNEKVKTFMEEKEDLDIEYVAKSSITIALVKNYSLFREVNRTALPKKTDFIGSSINSSRVLASNSGEVNTYFPNLVGVSHTDPTFLRRVKDYLNNIQIVVDELGVTFDTSFRYKKKSYYYNILKEENAIEEEYRKINKANISELQEGMRIKINKLNTLESTKYQFGEPINVEDYLMYRHCLLYNDITKEMAFINSNPNIRFYFKDDKKEQDRLHKFRKEINTAKANFVECIGNVDKFDAIYIQYCLYNNLPIISSLNEEVIEKEIKLDRFTQEKPQIFNKWFNNKNIILMGMIENLISRNILIRSQYNQNISSEDGVFIGANITEAVSWFNNPENADVVTAYKNRLKNI